MRRIGAVLATVALFAASASAQQPSAPQVTTQALRGGLHVMLGQGGGQVAGNVVASIGADGSLIVDTGFPVFVPQYEEAITKLGGGPIVYAINTHWHDDHAEGNKVLGPAGRAILIAHTNARAMMTRNNRVNVVTRVLDQPAYPPAALPVITFADHIELYFNGERLELWHYAPAHTTSDVAVIFRNANLVHMGDTYMSGAYPFFDVDNGGDFDGAIEFYSKVLDTIDRDTLVVPGHGAVATYADLTAYRDMLRTVRERMAGLIAGGATLEQVVAAKPTAEFDARYNDPSSYFLDRAYKSLAQ